jgi:hypothetical protein|tara:strand:- start:4438 stop:4596 length:159 start_codon:yes stop_codon:yes gene_type:complete
MVEGCCCKDLFLALIWLRVIFVGDMRFWMLDVRVLLVEHLDVRQVGDGVFGI